MTSYCDKLNPEPDQTWISNSFIRNRGLPNPVYDQPLAECVVNNPPPSMVYVRLARNSQGKLVFWLNGWQQPNLKLTRGKKYQFNIMTPGHPFVLRTTDGQVLSRATDYFTTTITASGFPETFRYECALHPGMGGNVQIV